MASRFTVMAFNLKHYLLYSSYFCCCIPVRFGFVIMTCLSFLLSGVLSVLVWFELSRVCSNNYILITDTTLIVFLDSYSLSSKEKTVFWVVGIVEVILFSASIIGCASYLSYTHKFWLTYDLHIDSLAQLHASHGSSRSTHTSYISMFYSISSSASTSSTPSARATDNK